MRALLFNAGKFAVEFDSYANRPEDIVSEDVSGKEKQKCDECVVVFITVERGDNKTKVVGAIFREVEKMCLEVGREKVVIVPFAHLSNNLENHKKSLDILNAIEDKLGKNLKVMRSHFGSNKSLLLEVHGHVGNVRYREF